LVVARTAQTQVLVGSGLVASEAAPLEALAVNPLTRLVVDVVVGRGPGGRVQLDGGAALGEEPHQHVVVGLRGGRLGGRALEHGGLLAAGEERGLPDSGCTRALVRGGPGSPHRPCETGGSGSR